MTSSEAPARWTSRPVQDLIGIAENVTFSGDPAALLRELLVTAGMTLKNPAGVLAANTRLLWGYAGALRAAAERTIGRDNPGPIAIARGDKRFADPA
jgi:polyhydroxyalkanoate synthase subunit PhaC